MEGEHPISDDVIEVKSSHNVVPKSLLELSDTSKTSSEVLEMTEESTNGNDDGELFDAPSDSALGSDQKDASMKASKHEIETIGTDVSPRHKSKSKTSKKKKKTARDDNSSSQTDLDASNSGLKNTDVVSSTSSKKKPKESKKKKKKKKANDDGEPLDNVSDSSAKPKEQKKKKKDDSLDKRESMHSNDTEDDKSTNHTANPSKKTKKKKAKVLNKNTVDMKKTKNMDPGQRTNFNDRRAKKFANDQPSDFLHQRSMSLDTSNAQYHSVPSTPTGRFNTQRQKNMDGNNLSGRERAHGGRGRGRGRGRGSPPVALSGGRSQRLPERRSDGSGYSQERVPYGGRGASHKKSPYGSRSKSQDRSPYGPRSVLQERLPNGNGRVTNGRGPVLSPRAQRRNSFPPPMIFDKNPVYQPKSPRGPLALQSQPSRDNTSRTPSTPKSILRNSSHHQMLRGSSHHHSIGTTASSSSSQRNQRSVSVVLSDVSTHSYKPRGRRSSFHSEMDSSDVESDDNASFAMDVNDPSFSIEDGSNNPNKQVPRTVVRGFARSLSGLGSNSSHHKRFMRSTGQSQQSLMTTDRPQFQNENRFIGFLRFIHFLAPHPDEDHIKKKIRIVTWTALILDFINAIVAITTYGGATTQCCGKSIMSAFGGNIDWDKTILVVTCVYLLLIFLEVVPVMRDTFPFNLLNPFVGFLITFAVFFSDSVTESAIMWTVEMLAVVCEVINYRLRLKRFAERKEKLKNTRQDIEKLRKVKRKVKNQYDRGSGRIFNRGDSEAQFVVNLDDDDSSFADESLDYDDLMETQHNSGDANTVVSRTAFTNVSSIGTVRETLLLRQRRQLMRMQEEGERDLQYHFIGATANVVLVVFSLLMLIIIAKNGGMCIVGMNFGNIFKNDQLIKCNMCDGSKVCEYCLWEDVEGTIVADESQCYYPYGIGK